MIDISFLMNWIVLHFGSNPAAKCAALFFATFFQEDLAVITGGIAVVNHWLPLKLAAPSLFFGIIVSDLGIYGLGRFARKHPWIRSTADSKKLEHAKAKLKKHLIPTVALCRTVPGFVFPTYLACGMSRIPFFTFAATTIVAAAIYVVLLLSLTILLGVQAVHALGKWIWIIPLTVLALVIWFRVIPLAKKLLHMAAKEKGDLLDKLPRIPDAVGHGDPFGIHPLRVCPSEKIPPLLFYTPVVLQALWLMWKYKSPTLPTAANPQVEAGGMWGESKSRLMRQVAKAQQCWIAPFATLLKTGEPAADLQHALSAVHAEGLCFPLVAKPDIGWQGYGVRRLKNEADLQSYIESYPKDLSIILQRPAPWQLEAGIFYVRVPGQEKGRVTSITFRSIPHVQGNGRSTVKELIEGDDRARFRADLYMGGDARHAGLSPDTLKRIPAEGEKVYLSFIGSLRTGGEYHDGRRHITELLSERFDAIAKSMPEFYFGRFDIRFASIEALEQGEDFVIFEINGAGSEAIHIWDPDMPVKAAYRELFAYQNLLFSIAHMNRENGTEPMDLFDMISFTKNYNRLVHSYPPSE